MLQGEITTLDLVIVGLYLIAMVAIGVYFVRRIQNTEDYYVADHSFGPLVLMATVCATIIGGSGLMGRAGKAYSGGFMAIMTALPYLLGMFIFSGISGRISDVGFRHNITSIPELFDRRFGKTAKLILAALIAFTMMGTVASQVRAAGTIINLLGGDVGLTYELGALIACIVFMLYTATSGLFGVVYTDVFQFYMLLIFVYILIPVSSLKSVGGWASFQANLDPALVKPYINGSILGDIVTYLVFTMAGAEMWQRAFAAKDRSSAKKGMFLGTTVYGLTIILVFFMGIIGHQVLGEGITNTDSVVPSLAIRVLPMGLTGLALAGLLSVIMSTADSYLLVSVQTCVHDIGKTINPAMPEKREILWSRIFSIILPLGALVIALYIQNAYDILMFSWSFYAAACGLPCFAALYWRKATSAGVIAGMIAGFVVCVGWKLAGLPFGLGAAVPGAIACAIALVCVSLATYQKHPSVFLAAE
ncbi:MAG: sodium:solute symporter family protein [Oscillospiraceae bacterium]|nr:sodium:solute symporter family protein [Oscillospiraceae bacterium]